MFSGLQGWHVIVIVVAIVLLFGAKRLPDAAKGIGHSLRIFKSEAKAMREQDDTDTGTGTDTDTEREQQAQAPHTDRLSAANSDTSETSSAPATAEPRARVDAQPTTDAK